MRLVRPWGFGERGLSFDIRDDCGCVGSHAADRVDDGLVGPVSGLANYRCADGAAEAITERTALLNHVDAVDR